MVQSELEVHLEQHTCGLDGHLPSTYARLHGVHLPCVDLFPWGWSRAQEGQCSCHDQPTLQRSGRAKWTKQTNHPKAQMHYSCSHPTPISVRVFIYHGRYCLLNGPETR
jgi:hypothetical protein